MDTSLLEALHLDRVVTLFFSSLRGVKWRSSGLASKCKCIGLVRAQHYRDRLTSLRSSDHLAAQDLLAPPFLRATGAVQSSSV